MITIKTDLERRVRQLAKALGPKKALKAFNAEIGRTLRATETAIGKNAKVGLPTKQIKRRLFKTQYRAKGEGVIGVRPGSDKISASRGQWKFRKAGKLVQIRGKRGHKEIVRAEFAIGRYSPRGYLRSPDGDKKPILFGKNLATETLAESEAFLPDVMKRHRDRMTTRLLHEVSKIK